MSETEILWGHRRAGDTAQSVDSDPQAVIVGEPDWFYIPDDPTMKEFAGRTARRVASARLPIIPNFVSEGEDYRMAEPPFIDNDGKDVKWHALAVDDYLINLVIVEGVAEGFAMIEVKDQMVATIVALASLEAAEREVLVHCGSEEQAQNVLDLLRDAELGGDDV
ncbi:MAG: hypothetical protein CMA63_06715 [Euryarchaeota archaeon]|nr:hypothetical protein [Euryarchaeota archaeon]|tara:strand:- start:6079 stop:6573 length:495 start_codon:yes stop_codon:yes gene_type:complete